MMVKMAKKAPMSPATATTAASTTASAFTSVNEEPVIWYAFYSEAAGREYYYEPKSRTATWIMPDDQNAHPRKDDERVALPPKVKRKVSFSADTGRILGRGSAPLQTGEVGNSDRSIVQEVSKLKAEKALYRKIAIFATFCLSALAAVAFLDSSVTIGAFLRLPSKNANGDVLGREALGRKKQAGKTHQINNAEAIVETRIVEEAYLPEDSGFEKESEDATTIEVKDSPEEQYSRSKEREEKQNLIPQVVENVRIPHDHSNGEDSKNSTSHENFPNKCKIPFVYIVSGHCRQMAKLVDMEAFTLPFLQ